MPTYADPNTSFLSPETHLATSAMIFLSSTELFGLVTLLLDMKAANAHDLYLYFRVQFRVLLRRILVATILSTGSLHFPAILCIYTLLSTQNGILYRIWYDCRSCTLTLDLSPFLLILPLLIPSGKGLLKAITA